MALFDPKKLHSYVKGEDEDNWIIAGFTPLGVETMPPHPTAILSRHGFPLDGTDVEVNDILDDELSVNDSQQGSSTEGGTSDEENVQEKARVLRCAIEEESECDPLSSRCSRYIRMLQKAFEVCAMKLGQIHERQVRRIMKVSPGEAKDIEVEELLRTLSGPLEVVHNVSLPEVRKYVDLWKDAIVKEVSA